MMTAAPAQKSGTMTSNRGLVLCVDDDPVVQLMLGDIVTSAGAECIIAATAHEAELKLSEDRFNLVVLDRRLPDSDGLLLMRTIKKTSGCPVVVLSTMDETPDIVLGIGLGAAEYLTKPINPLELGSRIKQLLGPVSADTAPEAPIVFNGADYMFNALTRRLDMNTATKFLAPAESRLLHKLLLNEGEVQTRDQLSLFACGRDWVPGDRTVDVLVNRLRGHLSSIAIEIVTVHRTGYVLIQDGGIAK